MSDTADVGLRQVTFTSLYLGFTARGSICYANVIFLTEPFTRTVL